MVEISRALPAPDRANLSRYGLYLDSNDITKNGVSFFFSFIYIFRFFWYPSRYSLN